MWGVFIISRRAACMNQIIDHQPRNLSLLNMDPFEKTIDPQGVVADPVRNP